MNVIEIKISFERVFKFKPISFVNICRKMLEDSH